MEMIVITNNPLVDERLNTNIDVNVKYYDCSYMDILKKVRDKIHLGHKLLTHPLSGSVKPNETPYKSVAISQQKYNLDFDSISVIEKSISTTEKFMRDLVTPEWNEEIKKDFMVIDLSLMKKALN